jgi:MoaA/NifB/PqqE/SkfB family radical SAM enzyme
MNAYDTMCCFRSAHNDSFPKVLYELNTLCNLKCPFCHARPHTNQGQKLDEIIFNLSLLKKWGIKDIVFSGGEPLLRRDISKILEASTSMGFSVDLCTNGTLVNKKTAKLLKEFLSEISISLNSANPETHNYICGEPRAFERTVEGIDHLINEGLEVHAIMVICDKTYPDIRDTLALFSRLNLQSVTLLAMLPYAGMKPPFIISRSTAASLRKELPELREMFRGLIINSKGLVSEKITGETCNAGKTIIGIEADGKLLPCIAVQNRTKARPLRLYHEYSTWHQVRDQLAYPVETLCKNR